MMQQYAQIDGVMTTGFGLAFVTLIYLMYQHQFKTRFPVLAVLLAALAVFGFVQNAWTLGFVLWGLSVSEGRRWWCQPVSNQNAIESQATKQTVRISGRESRLTRMFGK